MQIAIDAIGDEAAFSTAADDILETAQETRAAFAEYVRNQPLAEAVKDKVTTPEFPGVARDIIHDPCVFYRLCGPCGGSAPPGSCSSLRSSFSRHAVAARWSHLLCPSQARALAASLPPKSVGLDEILALPLSHAGQYAAMFNALSNARGGANAEPGLVKAADELRWLTRDLQQLMKVRKVVSDGMLTTVAPPWLCARRRHDP